MQTDVARQLAEVETEIADVCGVLNVAHGRLIALTARAIEGELWHGWGIRSVEHWLTLRAGVSRGQANRIAAMARRFQELPVTMRTLADGELTMDQAAAVAELSPAHAEAEATSLAKSATVTQLRTTLARYRFVDDGDAGDGVTEAPAGVAGPDEGTNRDRADAAGRVSFDYRGGRWTLHADLPADAGALVEAALREAKDALFRSGQGEVSWSDAVLEVSRRSLAADMAPSRVSHYRTWIHLDAAGGWINQGPTLPNSLIEKLTCDGVVQPLVIEDGIPVSVGRSTRVISNRLRRLVLDRDRCCIVRGCGARHHLEVHHLVHWSRGGATDLDNLAAHCPAHHDAHHRGDFTVTGNANEPGSLELRDRAGRLLCPTGRPQPPREGFAGAPRRNRYRPPTGERMQQKWVYLPPPKPIATAQRT